MEISYYLDLLKSIRKSEMLVLSLSVEYVADYLNSLLELDRQAISNLFLAREVCNDVLADSNKVIVRPEDPCGYSLGILGLLNGLFYTLNGCKRVAVVLNLETGNIIRFDVVGTEFPVIVAEKEEKRKG